MYLCNEEQTGAADMEYEYSDALLCDVINGKDQVMF